MSLHVCFVCNELPPAPAGGIGPCVATTARGLVSAGHQATVIGFYPQSYAWAEPGVRIEPILPNAAFGSYTLPGASRLLLRNRLAEVHRRSPIDIVEWPDYGGLYLNNLSGTVDVVRNHGPTMSHRLYGVAKRRPVQEFFELRTLRRIPNWIGVSEWFMSQWLAITQARPLRTTVIYNPVDCELFHPGTEPRDSNLVLYAGNLTERKGPFVLAAAAQLFLDRLPSARLLYVGREGVPNARRRILELAGAAAERIHFSDPLPQEQLAILMRTCAIFAMPSLLESFGNVWAEAMASATPVIASNVSAGPEVVPHGEAGFTVAPQDRGAISDAVVTLMTNSRLREQFGAQGRRIALERYHAQHILEKTVEFYSDCIRGSEKCNQALGRSPNMSV
jgi:glycosyltransferase involved in cell wall biosynthesis